MDQSLQAHVRLDVVSDVVRIDVRGSLTQSSRTSLTNIIQRIRRMGIGSHIRVDLGQAWIVESSALSGLRNDLNAVDGGSPGAETAGMPAPGGVSLELTPHGDDFSALPALELSGEFLASLDSSGTRPLTRFSDDELFAASDSVFGRLDDPADMARSELLATYEDIGMEISRREVGREPEPA